MLWTRDSKNRLLFVERSERTLIFEQPEILCSRSNVQKNEIIDEYVRNNMIEVCIIFCVISRFFVVLIDRYNEFTIEVIFMGHT